jgi:hypothetical protein
LTLRGKLRAPGLALLLAWSAAFQSAPAAATDDKPASPVAGWDAFVEGLRTLPERLLA